ncbi:MAG: hypothetical protein KIS78_17915 [Labilithrix sp.]|nr:hypothetical protein [Labilithrix sp.]
MGFVAVIFRIEGAGARALGGIVRSGAVALMTAACAPAVSPHPVAEPSLDVPRIDGGGAEPSTQGIRFGRSAPAVGARWHVSVDARSVAPDPQGGTQRSAYLSSYSVEVLATNGPAPSRVRLTFDKNVHRYQGLDTATSIDGKTYVVDDVPPYVHDDAGGPVPEEEAERVLDVFPDLGTRTRIDQVLPDAAMAVGDARDELAGAVLAVIHPRAWTLDAGSAVLARVEDGDAVFALAIDATGRSGLRMVVKGEARVRLSDARLTLIAVDGTYDPSGSASEAGTFTLRRTVRDR